MSVKLLTEHHLEFLSLKGGCTGSSESALVKMPHYWKLHVTAHSFYLQVTMLITRTPVKNVGRDSSGLSYLKNTSVSMKMGSL